MAEKRVSWMRELFRPEERAWRNPAPPAVSMRPRALSLKAVFWWAMAVAISLVIGNLL